MREDKKFAAAVSHVQKKSYYVALLSGQTPEALPYGVRKKTRTRTAYRDLLEEEPSPAARVKKKRGRVQVAAALLDPPEAAVQRLDGDGRGQNGSSSTGSSSSSSSTSSSSDSDTQASSSAPSVEGPRASSAGSSNKEGGENALVPLAGGSASSSGAGLEAPLQSGASSSSNMPPRVEPQDIAGQPPNETTEHGEQRQRQTGRELHTLRAPPHPFFVCKVASQF